MNAVVSYSSQYFVTRHSANLMEELQRRVSSTASTSLIYGVQGIGKTRLIQQFTSTRLFDSKVTFCSMTLTGYQLNNHDLVHDFKNFQVFLQELSSNGGICIVDQLEQAPEFIILQLLQFCSNVAEASSVSLILLCRSSALTTVYTLSGQLNFKIPSVEMKPLSMRESMQYLSAQLCPDQDLLPVLNRDLKRQLKIAAGVPGLLDQIIQQNAGRMLCRKSASKLRRFGMLGVFMLLATVLVGGFKLNQLSFNRSEIASVEESPVKAEPDIQLNQDSTLDTSEDEQPDETSASITSDPDSKLIDPDPVPQINSPILQKDVVADLNKAQETVEVAGEDNLFQQRLSATRSWLENSSDKTSTIQIMSLSQVNKALQPLESFIDNLAAKGLDPQKTYIYQLDKPTNPIYVVLYGSFASRAEARKKIDSLPPSLKANSPIIRTVVGIKNEINRKL